MNHYIIPQQMTRPSTAEFGGKGAQLSWLSSQGLNVPAWWILPASILEELFNRHMLGATIETLLADLTAQSPNAHIEQVASNIQQHVLKLTLPTELSDELNQLLAVYPDQFFAVRSSVLDEDSNDASFAGQMDSLLFQRGVDQLQHAILKVLASAFSYRTLAYRLQKGLTLTSIRSAVIIQCMIDSDVSGVMFTANPLTGNREQTVISANWGLGEGVVSGACNSDEFCIDANQTIHTHIVDKDRCIVFDTIAKQGTFEQEVETSRRQITCLSDAQLLELHQLGLTIAKLKRCPQDIEWAIKGEHIYLLQTRPITALPAPSVTEGQKTVFDNSNIQESYCGVTTPLTFSFASRGYKTAYEQTMRLLGVSERVIAEHQSMLSNMLGLIYGRIYYNINNWYRGLLFLPSFKTNKADMERMMGLNDPVDFIESTELSGWDKLRRIPQMLRALLTLLLGFRRMSSLVAEFKAHFAHVYASVCRDTLHRKTPHQLLEICRDLDQRLVNNWTTPIVNDFYVMMMNGRVHRTLLASKVEFPDSLQNNLLAGETLESTEPTKMLLGMCDYIRRHPRLLQAIENEDPAQLLLQLKQIDVPFWQQCLNYIDLYGDRTIGELKLETISLRQDSRFLFSILKNYLSRDDLNLAVLTDREQQLRQDAEAQAFTQIRTQLGRTKLRQFKKHLDKLRMAIAYRESMRLMRTRLFGLYRDVFAEIGQQLQHAGRLIDARDVFYLTVEELYAFDEGRAVSCDLKSLAAARKQEYTQYLTQEPDHHFWTWGMVNYQNNFQYPHTQQTPETDSAGTWRGTGCYPGVVTQSVRLIFSPEDELYLNGQILCTLRTDPGWAPLFPTAGGLLVERGSTLSHSAIVAREFGIPTIVGIPNITKLVKNAQWVTMDGQLGTVIPFAETPQTATQEPRHESAIV